MMGWLAALRSETENTISNSIVSGLPVFIGSWVSPSIKPWESKLKMGPLRAMTLCFGTFVLGSAGTLFL